MATVPTIYVLCGLPGSGKSEFAKKLSEESGAIIHSSDSIRAEVYGDENDQAHNNEVFNILHKRIKENLLAGRSVIYDATNINKKRRICYLNTLKNIPCIKTCVVIATSYEKCLSNVQARKRKLPREVLFKKYVSWQPPHISEGWDSIAIYYPWPEAPKKYNISSLLSYNQNNSHHSLSLGHHLIETCIQLNLKYPSQNDCNLNSAALLHDIGKPFTRIEKNSKGICDGETHYYNHNCVGAYDSMFYKHPDETADTILDIANLIYYHMHPYSSWKSDKVMERDRKLLGEEVFERVMKLHVADMAAH